MTKLNILLNIAPFTLSEQQRRQIDEACPGARIECAAAECSGNPDRLVDDDVDVLVSELVPSDLAAWRHLRLIQLLAAGINHLSCHSVWHSHVPVATASGVHSVPMGQFATTLLLMMVHRFPELMAFKPTRQWPDRQKLEGSSIRGLVAGILGYGSIGRECARQWHALGMRVICLKQDVSDRKDQGFIGWPGTGDPDGTIPERWFAPGQLREFLPLCDVLLITAPRTNRTHGMIGDAELALLKPSARVIVLSRGGILDEDALARALREGRIAGACLDCFLHEPLPRESPLFDAPNLILTPHMSGVFDTYWPVSLALLCENLRRLIATRPLLNLARGECGY